MSPQTADETSGGHEPDSIDPASGSEGNEVEKLQNALKEAEKKYLYLYADFDNFKKRAVKERSDLVRFGWEGVARDLLGVLDNLNRALDHLPESVDPNLEKGLKLILQDYAATLERQGVKPIEAIGKPFDLSFHEAIGQMPSKEIPGTILEEERKGYTLHGRLLRPSRVVISKPLE